MNNSLRIALVEPNQPDAHWFKLMMEETHFVAEVSHYSTGLGALKAWSEGDQPVADLIVVADELPMLILRDFMDSAAVLNPGVPIVVAAEPIATAFLRTEGIRFSVKPFSPYDVANLLCSISVDSRAEQPQNGWLAHPSVSLHNLAAFGASSMIAPPVATCPECSTAM